MATKKVEDKSEKEERKVLSNNKNKKMTKKKTTNSIKKKNNAVNEKKDSISKAKLEKVKKSSINKIEKKITCSKCGKKYLASLDECPKCGYSALRKNKSYYEEDEEDVDFLGEDNPENDFDDEEIDEEDYDDEDYDDEENIEEHDLKKEKRNKEEKKESKIEKEKVKKANNKKKKRKKYVSMGDSFFEQNEDLINLIKILVAVVLLVGIVYFVVAFLNGEFKKDEIDDGDEEVAATIQNEEILASSIFNKVDDEYYVLIYDGSSSWADYYSMIYVNYSYIEDESVLPLFWVNLSNKFNSSVVASEDDDTNPDAQKYSELSLSSPTLIHIKKSKNVGYYEGDEVASTLIEIIDSYSE